MPSARSHDRAESTVTPAQSHRDNETARLGRAEREQRKDLTTILNEIRRLEKASRTGPLSPDDAARLRDLRSRESQLHSQLSAGAADLRRVRDPATPDSPHSPTDGTAG